MAWPRDGGEMRHRSARYVPVIGRIKEGVSLESAEAEMKTIAARLAESHPKENRNWTAQLTPWRDHLTRDSKASLLILMGAVGLVLLIACANVASLLLGRAATRRKEIAIRLALGASRWRLLRQLLIESLLLAGLGGALGLLMNSFLRMRQVDVGYDPRGLMTMSLSFPAENKQVFARQVLERVAATPGVESVALMSYPTPGGLNFPFNLESRPLPEGDVTVAYSAISPAYFRTLRAPIRAGREFNDNDLPNSPGVAIINEMLARQYFAGEDPVGKKLTISYLNSRVTREIVGVARDIKQEEPSKPMKPEIFVPFAQLPWFSGTLLVRSINPDPLTVKNAAQQAIWSVNKELPESKVETLEQALSTQIAEPRLYTLLLGVFAAAALLLAAIGVYGVMSYAVTQRAREIGVRMALGAQTRDVLKLVIGQGMSLTLAGVAIGLVASAALTRFMKGLLFDVSATDPLTFAAITLLLSFVALLACSIPARRATKVDPMAILRSE
jgi:putative ABC transport system permease protein